MRTHKTLTDKVKEEVHYRGGWKQIYQSFSLNTDRLHVLQKKNPLREERTSSLKINPDGTFHDFGTGRHGDAIAFFQELKGLDFLPAIKELASFFNIPDEEGDLPENLAEYDIENDLPPGNIDDNPDEATALHNLPEANESSAIRRGAFIEKIVLSQDMTKKELAFWHKKTGLEKEDISKLGISAVRSLYTKNNSGAYQYQVDNCESVFAFEVLENRKYKLYQPALRRFGKSKSLWVGESLEYLRETNAVPSDFRYVLGLYDLKPGPCYLAAGEADFYALKGRGYNVFTLGHEVSRLPEFVLNFLEDNGNEKEFVTVVFDTDLTGLSSSKSLCEEYGFTRVVLPKLKKAKRKGDKPNHNDICDYIGIYGFDDNLRNALNNPEDKTGAFTCPSLPVHSLKSRPFDRLWLLPGLVMKGAVNGLVGTHGIGKTTFVNQLCLAVSGGCTHFLGESLNTHHKRTLFVSTEESNSLFGKNRRKQTQDFFGSSVDELRLPFDFWSMSEDIHTKDINDMYSRLKNMIVRSGGYDLIVFDAMQDLANNHPKTGGINSNEIVGDILTELQKIAFDNEHTAILIIHHTDKTYHRYMQEKGIVWADDKAGTGATRFPSKVRSMIVLSEDIRISDKEEKKLIAGLYSVKCNDDAGPWGSHPMMLSFNPRESLVFKRLGRVSANRYADAVANGEVQVPADLAQQLDEKYLKSPEDGGYDFFKEMQEAEQEKKPALQGIPFAPLEKDDIDIEAVYAFACNAYRILANEYEVPGPFRQEDFFSAFRQTLKEDELRDTLLSSQESKLLSVLSSHEGVTIEEGTIYIGGF